MKKWNPISFFGITIAIVFSSGMFAQEKTEVTLLVKKDGKVVKDTTYQFENAAEAKHAVKMMEILCGDDKDTDKHTHSMVFLSGDIDKKENSEFHGDSHVWISEEEQDGEHVRVIKREKKDGETIEIIIDKDKDGSWHVDSKELKDVDEDVRVIVVRKEIHCDQNGDEEIDVEVKVEKKVKRKQ